MLAPTTAGRGVPLCDWYAHDLATTPRSDTTPEKRYPDLPRRHWTEEEIETWLARVQQLKADVVARRGRGFTDEELDELLSAVREGRD